MRIALVGCVAAIVFGSGSARADFIFGEPTNLGRTVNSTRQEYVESISPDGMSLYFESDRPGGYGGSDIWVAKRASVSDPWGPPVNLGPEINTTQHDTNPSISADGLSLFFGRGSYSVADIWLAKRDADDAPWTKAVNLGPTVNSSRWEGSPHISADGLTLYFSSSRPGGFGSVDMYQVPIIPIIDLNGDVIVDAADMCIMTDHWGENYSLCDIGPMPWGDGVVDIEDLKVLAEHMEDLEGQVYLLALFSCCQYFRRVFTRLSSSRKRRLT